MDIWPRSNGPVQLFVPAYVPRSWVIISSISNVPVAVEVQLLDIIEPIGIVIVKVPVLPFIVPLTIIVLPDPPRCIVPENTDPVWVTCHVVAPAVDPAIPDPIIDPLESDAVPTQFPLIVAVVLGLVGAADWELHATAAMLLTSIRRTDIHLVITPPSLKRHGCTFSAIGDNCLGEPVRVPAHTDGFPTVDGLG